MLAVKDVRPYVARDVAADIVRLLSSGAVLCDGDRRSGPVRPADVAVLVQRNDDGATVRDMLAAVGVPVVLTSTTSVFLSGAAEDWLTLLEALEKPQRPGLARAAALTDFVGWDAARLAADDDAAFDELGARLHAWTEVLVERGVAALFEVLVGSGLVERVLATELGERRLTDLRHVGQSLHAAATEGALGVASLVEWLQRRIAEARDDVTEERSRRLDSDAAAVQVITVHRSKGLEFPIVYAPFLWDKHVFEKPDPLRLHDPAGQRVLDVGGAGGAGYDARRGAARRRGRGGVAPARVRRADPGPLPGGGALGAHRQHPRRAAAPAAARGPRRAGPGARTGRPSATTGRCGAGSTTSPPGPAGRSPWRRPSAQPGRPGSSR